MTTSEFNIEFDILWNNIMSNQAPGLSPYEKGVFLTESQETIVKGIYNGTLASPFESTEESRSYLSVLTIQGYPEKIANQASYPHITNNTTLYKLSEIKDIDNKPLPSPWFIIYEGVKFDAKDRCKSGDEGIVKPVTHDTFWETKRNPFRKDNERRVLRLSYQEGTDNIAELVSDYSIDKYFIRYIKRPRPIILEDLTGTGLTINGETQEQTSELNENIHRTILETAVKLAQEAWTMTNVKQ